MIFENLTFFWGWSQIDLEPFPDQKNSISTQTTMILKYKIHGAKHSPSPSSLNRPSADSGGPRASAWFWPFDPILLTEILDRSRNPSTVLQNYVRAWSLLNMSSIGPREDSNRSGNMSQKMSKIWENFENLTIFWRWPQINLKAFQDPKNSILTQKSMIFK